MTLGKKLSNYRKLTGMTQQQLGEHLNLSAQAISKWENDLAEPDLATLRTLADLYKVSIDELLDLNSNADGSRATDSEPTADAASGMKPPIGYCKGCGIAVTDENFGEKSPVLLCRDCVQRRADDAAAAKAAAERQAKEKKEAAERSKNAIRYATVAHRRKSFIVAGIVAGLLIALFVAAFIAAKSFSFGTLATALVIAGFAFCFTFNMFYDCLAKDVMDNLGGAVIKWPGLIFTFDLDGFLWLIGMKLLFAVLGFVIGVLGSILGFIVAMLISPFVFIYVLVKLHLSIVNYEKCDLIEDFN